jgi:hypothetical protein
MCGPSLWPTNSQATPGPMTSDRPYTSIASMPSMRSISARIWLVHGSAPNMPSRSVVAEGSSPILCIVSASVSM